MLDFFNADPDEYVVDLHGQRDTGAQARRRIVPVRRRRRVPADVRQSQLGERHPRVRARQEAAPATYVPIVLPEMRVDEAELAAASRTRHTGAATTCSPIRRNPTSPACSIRSTGFRSRRSAAGTCCSTRQRLRRPTASTSAAGAPDFVSQTFYKMFGYPTGVGCLHRAQGGARETAATVVRGRHDHGGVGAGRQVLSRRGRSRRSRTARRTISRCRPSSSASSIYRTIGIDTIHDARPLPHRLAASISCSALRHTSGAAAGAHLRASIGPIGAAAP